MKAETESSAKLEARVPLTAAATLGFRLYPFVEPLLLIKPPANDP